MSCSNLGNKTRLQGGSIKGNHRQAKSGTFGRLAAQYWARLSQSHNVSPSSSSLAPASLRARRRPSGEKYLLLGMYTHSSGRRRTPRVHLPIILYPDGTDTSNLHLESSHSRFSRPGAPDSRARGKSPSPSAHGALGDPSKGEEPNGPGDWVLRIREGGARAMLDWFPRLGATKGAEGREEGLELRDRLRAASDLSSFRN